ncbi:MAG: hypothetical protein KFH98_05200 [Gemmatimonadetes bacterium]|nr:hypothetical protein [Gemmatimonadota bacterium]
MTWKQQLAIPAFLAAVPASLVLWMLSYHAYVHTVHGMARAAYMVPYILTGGLLFGLPLILGIMALVAWPAFLLLRSTMGVTLPATLVAGALCGFVAREATRLLWAQPEFGFLPVPVVLVTGIGTAWVWWRVWTATPSSAHDSPAPASSASPGNR